MKNGTMKDVDIEKEASGILNFLASCPGGISSATGPVVQKIMLTTVGRLTACGELYDIVAKPLGAEVFRLTLRKVEYKR